MKFLSLLLLALLETTSAGVTGSCTDLLSFHGTNIKIMGPLVGPGKCLIPEQAIGNGNDDIPVWGHMDMFIPMALSPTLQRRGSSGYSGGGGGVRGGSISGTGSTDDLGSGGGGGGGVSGTGSKDNLGSGGSGSGAVEMTRDRIIWYSVVGAIIGLMILSGFIIYLRSKAFKMSVLKLKGWYKREPKSIAPC